MFSFFLFFFFFEGPSGSGKTTLLDLLGGRKTKSAGRQEGTIIIDGMLGSGGGASSAYVMQVRGGNAHHDVGGWAGVVRVPCVRVDPIEYDRACVPPPRMRCVLFMISLLLLLAALVLCCFFFFVPS